MLICYATSRLDGLSPRPIVAKIDCIQPAPRATADKENTAMLSDSRVDEALDTALAMGEVGIQVAAYSGDRLIVDTWAGSRTPDRHVPVDGETLFLVFSITKAVSAVAIHLYGERGLVAYDEPVAEYWPEFAAEGKGAVTVRDVLSHRSGVPQMPADLTPSQLGDWDWIVKQLAAMEPLFPANSRNTYQALSFGWLVGEIVRRTDPKGRSFSQFVRDELGVPLGAPDLHIGLDAREFDRLATVSSIETPQPPTPIRQAAVPSAVDFRPEIWNRHEVLSAPIPGAGGVMTARSVARVFAMLANGG